MSIKIDKQTPSIWGVILVLGVMSSMFYSFHVCRNIPEQHAPLVDAVMEVKLETTLAHLWFEKIISGNRSVGIDNIWDRLDRAEWRTEAMLNGDVTQKGQRIFAEEPELHNAIKQLLKSIIDFRLITQERWNAHAKSSAQPAINQKFDKIFAQFITSTNAVKATLRQIMDKQLQQLYFLQGLLIVFMIALSALILFMIKRYENQRERDMQALQEEEKHSTKTKRLYETLSCINQVIVRAHDRQTLVQEVCDIATEFGQFKLAWIGFIDEDNAYIKPAAFSGEGADYIHNLKISIADEIAGRGPTGKSIREDKYVIFNDLENDSDYAPWRKNALEKGYRSSGAFPIKLHGSVIGALNVYAVEAGFFDECEINLLEEVAQDIALALEKFETEEKHKQAEKILSSHLYFLQGMARINYATQQATDIDQMMSDALQVILELFEADRAWLFSPCDPDAASWRIPMERTRPEYPGIFAHGKKIPMEAEVAAVLREALDKDDVITFDYRDSSTPQNIGESFSILSQMHIAIHPFIGSPWMLGIHQCSYYRDWTNEEKYLFHEIAYRLGNALGMQLVIRDLQESEAKFRSIFQSSVVGMIVVIDGNGLITEWNAGAELAFGYSAKEAIDQPLSLLIPERYREAHAKGFAQAITQGGLSHSGVTQELSGLRKNGTEFPLELTLGSWKRNGKLYFSAIILDITERKQSEAVLRRSHKMEALGQLTGGIAHDFNNILGIILGNVELLERHIVGDEKALNRLEAINKSALRAADLTKQLLGFSRSQAAQTRATDINKILAEMGNLIRRSITPEVEVNQQLAHDLWLTEIDPGDFQDALLNLILNARDAMPGGGQLTFETSNCTLNAAYCTQNPGAIPGEYVQLTVSDTGEGISPEVRERIFEPFFTTKVQGKGTGLGLAMVFGFINRSGGHINVYSELGIGTSFRFYLPRLSQQEQVIELVDERTDVLPQGHETILAVDDEKGLLELTQASLESLGYCVITASDGQEALVRLANDSSIGLLFSDVVMPGGMNGYELAERATTIFPNLKVLLTSGYTKKTVVHNGLARFTGNLLSKPYSQAELAQRVRAVLGEPKQDHIGQDASESVLAQHTALATEWNSDLCIGIKAIDDDHRTLLALVNQSNRVATDDKTKCAAILDQLWDYTQTHFRREEMVMRVCAYPELTNHQQVHQLLAKQVEKMQRNLHQGTLSADVLATFLGNWLIDHIQGMDSALVPYCKDKVELIEQTLMKADMALKQESSSNSAVEVTAQTSLEEMTVKNNPEKPRLIIVDDELELANLIRETAEIIGFEVHMVMSAKQFLQTWKERENDVIVIDLVMPDTDGIELTGILAEQGSAAPIILVSGYNEELLDTAGKLAEAKGLDLRGTFTKPINLHEISTLLQGIIHPDSTE